MHPTLTDSFDNPDQFAGDYSDPETIFSILWTHKSLYLEKIGKIS